MQDAQLDMNENHTLPPLRLAVHRALEIYFSHLDPNMLPTQLYDLVMQEVEAPLIAFALRYLNDNQSKVAQLLGMSRSTLRKKMQLYQLD